MAEPVEQAHINGSGRAFLRGARVLAVSCAFFWSAVFFGIIDLATPFDTLPWFVEEFYDFYRLETGWGLFFTVVLPVPFLGWLSGLVHDF